MSANSKIEWTHHTFNPWWGCVEVSPACDNCYARSNAKRYGHKVWGKDAPRRMFSDSHWAEPIKWNAAAVKEGVRKRVFCGSMCDVMEDREDLQPLRLRLYGLIQQPPHLDWLLLTKRPQNFRRYFPPAWLETPEPNVWGMTTVESSKYLWRIDALKGCPFVVDGLSIEPLLEDMPNLGEYLDGIDWVITGGESGSSARPPHPDWIRRVRDFCINLQIPYFHKQWGEWAPLVRIDGIHESPFGYNTEVKLGFSREGKRKAGRLLDGVEWSQFPEVRA